MRYAGGKEHEFRGFVPRIVRTVTEVRARAAQRRGTVLDGGADGIGDSMG
jgi:hypothetical protein